MQDQQVLIIQLELELLAMALQTPCYHVGRTRVMSNNILQLFASTTWKLVRHVEFGLGVVQPGSVFQLGFGSSSHLFSTS